jgi:hypothetical protein
MRKLLSVVFVLLFVVSFTLVGCKKEESAKVDASGGDTAQATILSKEIAKDGHFIAYENGTVLDTANGLMWAAKDNGSDINWTNAKKYCESYEGGGYTDWRMPTQDELTAIIGASEPYKTACGEDAHITKLINLSCVFVWGSDTFSSDEASSVYIGPDGGATFMVKNNLAKNYRALPVRGTKK